MYLPWLVTLCQVQSPIISMLLTTIPQSLLLVFAYGWNRNDERLDPIHYPVRVLLGAILVLVPELYDTIYTSDYPATILPVAIILDHWLSLQWRR